MKTSGILGSFVVLVFVAAVGLWALLLAAIGLMMPVLVMIDNIK